MLKYSKIKENEQQLLALLSMTIEEFEELLQVFESIWMQQMK
jgi:NTP pyrophosphatase (non-canonical NTP hydrolase)